MNVMFITSMPTPILLIYLAFILKIQCMILLLLAIDDAEVRKITNFGLATTKALTLLVAANTLQSVNGKVLEHIKPFPCLIAIFSDHFRSLAVPAASFYNLAVLRCEDISDKGLQYELRCAIATLRQSLPMLSTSLQMAIKYPDQPKALKGRDYCVQQVSSLHILGFESFCRDTQHVKPTHHRIMSSRIGYSNMRDMVWFEKS